MISGQRMDGWNSTEFFLKCIFNSLNVDDPGIFAVVHVLCFLKGSCFLFVSHFVLPPLCVQSADRFRGLWV